MPQGVHPGTPTMDPNQVMPQLATQMGQLQLSGASVGDDHGTFN